jgi:hypothetical protein
MDVTETPQGTSGLCTEQGTKHPKDARVSELIWSRSGMLSGAKAWDLLDGAPGWHHDGRPVLPGQDHAADVAKHLSGVALPGLTDRRGRRGRPAPG